LKKENFDSLKMSFLDFPATKTPFRSPATESAQSARIFTVDRPIEVDTIFLGLLYKAPNVATICGVKEVVVWPGRFSAMHQSRSLVAGVHGKSQSVSRRVSLTPKATNSVEESVTIQSR
jgi:hypothetical protein